MKREKMKWEHAKWVCQNQRPDQDIENRSVLEYGSPEAQAREFFDYSAAAWSLLDKDGIPKAIFGFNRLSRTTLSVWCVSATFERRIWGYIAQALREIRGPLFKRTNVMRIHAIVCRSRPEPMRFAKKMGMRVMADMPDYGVGGRAFTEMVFTRNDWIQAGS